MPKVKSRGRASRASDGAQTRASPRASVRASSVASRGLPARSRRQSAAPEPGQATAQEPPVPTQPQPQYDALLSPQLMETLINRVADEVSRRLSPSENPERLPPTSSLEEVPATSLISQPHQSTLASDNVASTVVQGSLADASATLMGLAPSDGPPQVPGQCFQSVALPVDCPVTEKLKEKIWKDEYIDFGFLLANPVHANRYQLAIQNPESGPLPSLCIEPVAKTKKITSIDSWLNCFHIFVGIYTRQFPH